SKQTKCLKDAQKKMLILNNLSSNSECSNKIQFKEMQKAIDYLIIMLPSESKQCDYLDREYLKLINLTDKDFKNYRFAESSSISASNPAITNDSVLDLYNNEESDNAYKEDK
ncbi:22591_t:CDS:2, partial [Gigaspora margarita]